MKCAIMTYKYFSSEQMETATLFQANDLVLLHFSQRIKYSQKTTRNPQKFQEKHYLCIWQAFCNIHAEISYQSIHYVW